MSGCAAVKVANRGTSHFSATASTETIRTRRGPAALAFRDAVDFGEDALHLLEVGPAAAIEAHAALAAVEQRHVEVLLQHSDAVGDPGRRAAQLRGGAGEALVAGRGLEEAQAVERGQEQQRDSTSGGARMPLRDYAMAHRARRRHAGSFGDAGRRAR